MRLRFGSSAVGAPINGLSSAWSAPGARVVLQMRAIVLVALMVCVPAAAFASSVASLVVFGDSLSDQGNASALTGGLFPPSPYAHRASNGPVAVEVLASALGVPLASAAAGGSNYAVIGAATGPVSGIDNVSAVMYGVPALFGTGVLNQVAAYLTAPVANPETSLFVVWAGANDLFLDATPATAAHAIANITSVIQLLYGSGARQFLIPNLPDLSLTPSGLTLPPLLNAQLHALSVGFNVGLGNALGQLQQGLPGIDITPFDTFALLTAISATPSAYGFTNAGTPCLTGDLAAGGSVCADPGAYVFWDAVHPTAAAHKVLGSAFVAAVDPVPEPSTLALLGSGIVVAVRARRRRRDEASQAPASR